MSSSTLSPGPASTKMLALRALIRRDGNTCVWCREPLTPDSEQALVATVVRPGAGGPASAPNALLSCSSCDCKRGAKETATWLLECAEAGLRPDWQAVERSLRRLQRSDKQSRKHTAAQLAILSHGRRPGEQGRVGLRRQLIARDGDGCVWCSEPLPASSADCTIEHVLPTAVGGPNAASNMMCACFRCNNCRQDMRVGAWVATCEFRGLKVRRDELVAVLEGLARSAGGRVSLDAQRELEIMAVQAPPRKRRGRATARRWRWL